MDARELDYAKAIAAEHFDRGDALDVMTIAKLTKKLTAVHYGGIDVAGYEQRASLLGRFGTLHDEAETATAVLKIEPGLGRTPRSPKRPPTWAARHAVVVRDKGARRGPLRSLAALAALALLIVGVSSSGIGWPQMSTEAAVHASFDELVEELGGPPVSGATTTSAATPTNWLTASIAAFAADYAKGYRRSSSPEAAADQAEDVRKRLLAYAEGEKIKIEFVCPPTPRGHDKVIGDYLWPRKMRLCPGFTGLEGAELVAHELAHHLQGTGGRLKRANLEDEADAVALTALKTLWLPVTVSNGAYLAKPGNHATGIVAARAPIEAMAATLVRAAQ